MKRLASYLAISLILTSLQAVTSGAEGFTVTTYNLENYVDSDTGSRRPKSAVAKAKIRESLCVIRPDVLAVQEIGSTNTLLDLRSSLKQHGLDYPFWEHVSGFDTNIHVAVLSRFPITARRPHTRANFLLNGRRFRVSRGFAEVDIQAAPRYTFTLITAHLKSRRPVPQADEADLREQEALVLREIIDARLNANPEVNLIVLGDFNDVKDARSTRIIIGRGRTALVDTRPAERNGDNQPSEVPGFSPRNIAWTHFYGKEDSYSRIDYILLSQGMAKEWNPNGTYILALPNWGVGSDHRPIVASFFAENR